jgi:cell division transport system ATP-binding protein
MIEYRNVSKRYGKNIGVAGIDIRIEDGEFVFLVGPSGAGKSTFVKLLLKMIDADKGRIIYNGYDVTNLTPRKVPRHRRSMGIVFQDFSLLPKKTVFENVAFAMEIVQRPTRVIQKQVPQILELVGISAAADKYPTELSIGEQQRVAIARAIMNNPSVLIADEPTGNLDPDTGWEIMRLLEQINRRGTTVLMVTHSREIVNAMNKRVVAIKDGRLVRDERGGFYHPEYDDDPPAQKQGEEALPL